MVLGKPRNDEDSGVLGKANNQAKSSSLRDRHIKFIAHLVKQAEAISSYKKDQSYRVVFLFMYLAALLLIKLLLRRTLVL
jgi:hypothetical protein